MSSIAAKLGVRASALSSDPRQASQTSRQLGFGGLLFDAYSSSLNLPDLSGSGRREFVRLLSTQEQKLIGLRVDLPQKGFGPGADLDRLLDQLDKVLESAAGLGSPLVCIDVGPLPEPPPSQKPKPPITKDLLGLLILPPSAPVEPTAPPPTRPIDPVHASNVDAALSALGAKADRYSAIVAISSELSSLAAIERAIAAARCPWFGWDLDPVALLKDPWLMDEAFSRLGAALRHIRARDAIASTDRRTKPTPIGAGSTEWAELLGNLEAASYNGWITIDPTELPDRPAAAKAGRKHLLSFEKR